MKKTLLDMSLVLFIVISLSLSVVASDALLGGTDWNIGIGTNKPEKNVNAPGDIRASDKLTLQDRLAAAQDVDRTIPEALEKDRAENASAGYGSLTTVLVEAVKELNAENEQLKQQNRALEARVSEIESTFAILTADGNVKD